jgi:hypothetical protein
MPIGVLLHSKCPQWISPTQIVFKLAASDLKNVSIKAQMYRELGRVLEFAHRKVDKGNNHKVPKHVIIRQSAT